jgi:hypothetical protein
MSELIEFDAQYLLDLDDCFGVLYSKSDEYCKICPSASKCKDELVKVRTILNDKEFDKYSPYISDIIYLVQAIGETNDKKVSIDIRKSYLSCRMGQKIFIRIPLRLLYSKGPHRYIVMFSGNEARTLPNVVIWASKIYRYSTYDFNEMTTTLLAWFEIFNKQKTKRINSGKKVGKS